ncbi:MAG: histone deacetylase [Proteobacteria bacterium]|nr:histone deacetylase [Pseudomonadota bacterium]MBU1649349.1 histone deacetylase [Pseudomonadota bacterium]
MNRLGLVFDSRYLHHAISNPSPENPDRLRSLYLHLQQEKYNKNTRHISPREVTSAEICMVHSSFYVEQLREHAVKADPFSYDRDTYLMDDSLPTARLAAGGCLALADRIMAGEIDYGFSLIRPPGHHASAGRGMGFCIFNNVAITAEYLRRQYGLRRILILDFDVHHANGTQEIFYDSNEVLLLSIHQKGIFPFTGDSDEIGIEGGAGYTVNIPVHSQFGDSEYTYLLGHLLQGLVEQYLPQFILVSAGYDGHRDDSISGTLLSTQWFATVTHLLRRHAFESCNNRLLYVLEGGYNSAALEKSVLATIDAMLVKNFERPGILSVPRAEKLLVDHPLRQYWTI